MLVGKNKEVPRSEEGQKCRIKLQQLQMGDMIAQETKNLVSFSCNPAKIYSTHRNTLI